MTNFVDSIQMPKRKTKQIAPEKESQQTVLRSKVKPADAAASTREIGQKQVVVQSGFARTIRHGLRALLASKAAFVLILVSFVIPLSAFEAHVINVTATIERPPSSCDARSPGYWKNHEGCVHGSGSSIWASQVNQLSATFSSVFSSYTGAQICEAVDSCPGGNSTAAKRCRAKRHLLSDELNVVSSHQDLAALLAGSDNGSSAFDNLGLSPTSTVGQALAAVEAVIANPSATVAQLDDAATVAARIYNFYEDENPTRPACVYSFQGVPLFSQVTSQGKTLPAIEPVATSTEPFATSTEPATTSTEPVATSTEEITPPETPISTELVTSSTEPVTEPSPPASEPPPPPPSESPPESPPPSEPPPVESPPAEPPPPEPAV